MNDRVWKIIAICITVLLALSMFYLKTLHSGAMGVINGNEDRIVELEKHSARCVEHSKSIDGDIGEMKVDIGKLNDKVEAQGIQLQRVDTRTEAILKGIERIEKNHNR